MALVPLPSPPQANTGDAAFRVLSNPQLFRLIPQWTTGWPARVTQRWREIAATVAKRHALPKWYRPSSERRVELFMRELLLTGDIETLRLTVGCKWRDRDDPKLKRFRATEPQFAVRAGHAETVRWALIHYQSKPAAMAARPITLHNRSQPEWLWQEAMIYFPGHCGVLDVLRELLPVTWQFWANKDDCIRSAMAVQWIVDAYGVKALSPRIMEKAALQGNLPLVEFMATIPGQDMERVMARVDEYSRDVRVFLEKKGKTWPLSAEGPGFIERIVKQITSRF